MTDEEKRKRHREAARKSYETRKALVGAEVFLAQRREWAKANSLKCRAWERNRKNKAERDREGVKRVQSWKKSLKTRDPEYYKAIQKRHYDKHKDKIIAKAMKRHWANRDTELLRFWRNMLKRVYGITEAQYHEMGPICQICGATESKDRTPDKSRGKRLSVDHDKASGKVRGKLCNGCNVSIGHFNHDRDLMLKAIEYLDRTKDGFQFKTA